MRDKALLISTTFLQNAEPTDHVTARKKYFVVNYVGWQTNADKDGRDNGGRRS